MKIFYLSNSYIPSRTANSVHVMKMCNAFSDNGHEVKLFARESKSYSDDVYKDYGVSKSFSVITKKWPKIKYFGGLIYGYSIYNVIKKYLNSEEKIDVLYGRDIYSLYFSKKLKIPLIYEAHVFPESSFKQKLEKLVFKSKNFHRLVVISNELKKKYIHFYNNILNDNNVVVACDGCDLPRKESENKANMLSVGYVGHLYPGKGMEIIEKIAISMIDTTFHIVGGTDKDIIYWKNRIKTGNIIFHGFVKQNDLYKYYNKFNIVLAPYLKKVEGYGGKSDLSKWMSPLKIFEYMANKKVIIASDLPVIREVLKNGVNSILCNPQNTSEWVEAIRKLQADNALGNVLCNNGYKDLLENYTWKQRAKVVIN